MSFSFGGGGEFLPSQIDESCGSSHPLKKPTYINPILCPQTCLFVPYIHHGLYVYGLGFNVFEMKRGRHGKTRNPASALWKGRRNPDKIRSYPKSSSQHRCRVNCRRGPRQDWAQKCGNAGELLTSLVPWLQNVVQKPEEKVGIWSGRILNDIKNNHVLAYRLISWDKWKIPYWWRVYISHYCCQK